MKSDNQNPTIYLIYTSFLNFFPENIAIIILLDFKKNTLFWLKAVLQCIKYNFLLKKNIFFYFEQ